VTRSVGKTAAMSEPAAGYVAVIFSSQRVTGPGAEQDGYAEMAVQMDTLARQQPGFLDIEGVRDASGRGITVAYFDSDASARAWKANADHLGAQRLGRQRWYDWYHLRVAAVEREYSWTRPTTILHAALPDQWAAALRDGDYRVSTRGKSLEEEGFIHCSFDDQVEGVANRYYADLDELTLLRIDPKLLTSEVIPEPPFPGAPEDFPHIYGPIEPAAVIASTTWRKGPDGWRKPDGF
jgi:glutathione S-transferase